MSATKSAGLEIRQVSAGPYDNNSYVLVCPETRQSVIVDTPAEPEKVLALAQGTTVAGILLTHCHMDHILGYQQIKGATGAPVWVHPSEASLLPTKPEHAFVHNGVVTFGSVTLKTVHVPGHTTGGTALIWNEHLFSGDVLFPNGPGRTTSPENFKLLVNMLAERIFVLADEMQVHPGHGKSTILGREKAQFTDFSKRSHRPDLCGDILWTRD